MPRKARRQRKFKKEFSALLPGFLLTLYPEGLPAPADTLAYHNFLEGLERRLTERIEMIQGDLLPAAVAVPRRFHPVVLEYYNLLLSLPHLKKRTSESVTELLYRLSSCDGWQREFSEANRARALGGSAAAKENARKTDEKVGSVVQALQSKGRKVTIKAVALTAEITLATASAALARLGYRVQRRRNA